MIIAFIILILILILILLLVFLYSACKISGDISRDEEKYCEKTLEK